jgi:hypothetical protein
MKRLFLGLLLLAIPATVAAYETSVQSTAKTGIAADACSGGVTSEPIQMDQTDSGSYNTIDWSVTAATIGSTTTVTVTCFDSYTSASGYTPIMFCPSSASATCAADARNFPISGSVGFSTRWYTGKRWIKCTFTCTGSGTINASAVLSKQ